MVITRALAILGAALTLLSSAEGQDYTSELMKLGMPGALASKVNEAALSTPFLQYDDFEVYQVQAPTVATVALAGSGAGNVDNGAHKYKVTFVTAIGETELGYHIPEASVTVVDKNANGKVAISNIAVGGFGTGVTSRKLYRTAAGGSVFKLLATISDNTTTTYTDNIADSGLGSADATYRPNTTASIYLNTSLDRRRIAAQFGVQNTSFGVDALADVTTGYWNVAMGEGSLTDVTTGHQNSTLGLDALNHLTTGNTNVAVGIDSLYANTTGSGNVAVGAYSLIALDGGGTNIAIGKSAGAGQTAGSGNIVIGNAIDLDSLTGSNQLNIGGAIKSSDLTTGAITFTGAVTSSATGALGWAVVDGTDNTACTTQCTSAAVFGFNLSAGATAPVIVGPSDATADICLCAGAS